FYLELPHHHLKAVVSNKLSVVESLINDLRETGFEIKTTDINRSEPGNYEILLEIQGAEESLSKIPELVETVPEVESINIIPE
ncbi:MAG: hypothetical protein ABEK50_11015, partial [bacterium]